MDPITRRNNSEIQQLRMGPPMKIRAQLVIGRWFAGSSTCQVLEPSPLSLSLTLSRQILVLFICSPATRSLRAYCAVTPAAYPHDTQLRTSVSGSPTIVSRKKHEPPLFHLPLHVSFAVYSTTKIRIYMQFDIFSLANTNTTISYYVITLFIFFYYIILFLCF